MESNIWVIIPAHNEQQYITTVLSKLRKVHPQYIVVDDGSSDNTLALSRRYCKHVLHHETNLGKGAAMKTGCEYAFQTCNASAVIFLDADDQHDVANLPQFCKLLEQGHDIVFGVRRFSSANMPLLRFVGNKFASIMVNLLFGVYIPDIPSGYKALSKKAYKKVLWNSKGYEVEVEIASRVAKLHLPFQVVEIESIYHDADKGMTAIDAMHITRCLIQWKLGL